MSDYFHDFSDGSFRAARFWVGEEDEVLYTATAVLLWDDIGFVQSWPTPSPLPARQTPQGDKCVICWQGEDIYLLGDYSRLLKAWADYRRKNRYLSIGAN